ncbi:MAG: hypothetical protein RMJ56_09080 [Gemmataceae bacterium]|nr:hypothetical protein [Gemmata sp.]MDW8197740.1 hypothetical protein [Gemmataceae bacterium]
MTLTNHKTVKKTATVASVTLVVPADRIGLELGMGLAYPAGYLSPGACLLPPYREPEQPGLRPQAAASPQRMLAYAAGTANVPQAGPASWAGSSSPLLRPRASAQPKSLRQAGSLTASLAIRHRNSGSTTQSAWRPA